MICVLIIAMGIFARVTIMTWPRHTLPSVPDVESSSSSVTRPLLTNENFPPIEVQRIQKEGIGSLGLPKRLKDDVLSTASDNINRRAAVGEGVSGTSSIGRVPGCVESNDVLPLVDSHEHLLAVDEAGTLDSFTPVFQTSHGSGSGPLLER